MLAKYCTPNAQMRTGSMFGKKAVLLDNRSAQNRGAASQALKVRTGIALMKEPSPRSVLRAYDLMRSLSPASCYASQYYSK